MTDVPEFSTLRVEVDATASPGASGPIGRMTLTQGDKLNPLGTVPLREIAEAAQWFNSTDVHIVIVTGEGRGFSSGFDLREFAGTDSAAGTSSRDQADLGRLMAEAMDRMSALTIAAIKGPCVGGGVVLAAVCDLRIAADDTVFSIPEVDLGIPLAWGGIPRLVREIGPALTRELVLTCRPFTPEEALRIGFLNRVVPRAELESTVDELAGQLAEKAPSVVRATKRQVNEALEDVASTAGSWADADQLGAAMRDPDARAAARAYLASRSKR
jgi:enoyl-CoA hydratase/carnithine racemase